MSNDPSQSEEKATEYNIPSAQASKSCDVPYGGFRSWKEGRVTTLTSHVELNCSKLSSGDEREIESASS